MSQTPHSNRAERVLISGLLREPQLVTEEVIRRGLEEADLYDYLHRIVYRLIWDLVRSDLYTIPGPWELYQLVICNRVGHEFPRSEPAVWILDVLDCDPTGLWCYNAISLIKETSARRAAIRYADELARDARDGVTQFST
jgi:replicative DNA helicase